MKSLKKYVDLLKILALFLILSCISFKPIQIFSAPIELESHFKVNAYFSPSSPKNSKSPYVKLTNAIEKAESSIYWVAYGFDLFELTDLIINKYKKQSKLNPEFSIQFLIEKDSLENPETTYLVKKLQSNQIKVFFDRRNSGIMHNKFMVFDEQKVIAGSANFTLNGYFHHYNDIVVIENEEIANRYLRKFLELSSRYQHRKFIKLQFQHANPPIITDFINEKKETIELMFSRSTDNIVERLQHYISLSQKEIDFMIFAFSSKDIAEPMLDLLYRKKIKIKGIFDDSFESQNILKNWSYLPFQKIWLAGGQVIYDGEGVKVHHKNLIIDSNITITGSFNFSANATKNNDENLLIIKSPRINQIYKKQFSKLWSRFPKQTEFEKYIISLNRKNKGKKRKRISKISFSDYQKKFQKKNDDYLVELMAKPYFKAKVKRVLNGDLINLEVKSPHQKTPFIFTVKLFGVETPITGTHSLNQQPQSSWIKEKVALELIQQSIAVTGINKKNNRYQVILTDLKVIKEIEKFKKLNKPRRNKGQKNGRRIKNKINRKLTQLIINQSFNQKILDAGWAYLSSDHFEVADWSSITKKNVNLIKNNFLTAWQSAVIQKKFLFGPYPLKESPDSLKKKLEKTMIDQAFREGRWSVEFKEGVLIGNRNTQKVYTPDNSYYFESLRDTTDEKLIFFENIENAKKAGYKVVNQD